MVLANKSIAEGVVFFDYQIEHEKGFASRYRQRCAEEPKLASAQAYDSVYLIKEVIERCGARAQAIKRCLLAVDYKGISGPISFDKDGNFAADTEIAKVLTVKNGEFVPVQAEVKIKGR